MKKSEIDNPYKLPNDEDVFLKRIRDRQKETQDRKQWNKLKIWEKTSKSSKSSNKKQVAVQAPINKTNNINSKDTQHVLGERLRERENITDFIKKKREMFLLQMSLDTKKEEIRKIEKKTEVKKQDLIKSEAMLEEDAARFERFLQDNDAKANDAIKHHDREAKLKQEKAQEIKRIHHEINSMKIKVEKYNESLVDCTKYKEFLDNLTPKKWTEENKNNSDIMYFKNPQQLFDVFASLEKRNLFLIQNAQETEETLDELKQEFIQTKKQWESKTSSLQVAIDDLQSKIKYQENKAIDLKKREILLCGTTSTPNNNNVNTNTDSNNSNKLIYGLKTEVENVFKECGFSAEQTPNTLEQLQKIEEHLEFLISSLNDIPDEKRRIAEKKAESERRNRLRKEKLRKTEEQYQKRLATQLERAKRVEEHIKQHKKGKPVMFRSAPNKKKKKKKSEVDLKKEQEQEEYNKFFT